jgi:hypothetical protein
MSSIPFIGTFTCASQKDHRSRVTYRYTAARKGDSYIISVQHRGRRYDVYFYCNRDGETLKTTSWPTGLINPKNYDNSIVLPVIAMRKI